MSDRAPYVEHYTESLMDPKVREKRIERLKRDTQFGCAGRHRGDGSPGCPRTLHHHHDIYCAPITPLEWALAGRTGPIEQTSRA